MQGVRALIVDDFKAWRGFVCSTLEKVSDLLIVGEASDGLEAVQKAQELQPDLVLLDIGLPGLNGIDVARHIGRSCQASKIVFVTENHAPDIAEEASQVGAAGYVVKSSAANDLIPAIKQALNGQIGPVTQFVSRRQAQQSSVEEGL
jgi:DNA-binding NarL/FixJ family response regulator